MIRRLVLVFLLVGSSNAIKGLRRRAQDGTTSPPVTTTTGTGTDTDTATTPPGVIVNNDGLPKAPKEEGLPPKEPKEEGLAPKEPKDDPKLVKEDGVGEPKEKKEKEDKTCKKRKKEGDGASAVQESSTRRRYLQEVITNQDGLPKEPPVAKEPPAAKESAVVPPEPVSPPAAQPVDDVVEPVAAGDGDVTADVVEDEPKVDDDAPFCADVGTKSRTQAECAGLLSNGPNGKSIKGEVQFEVTYNEEDQSILENVKGQIKTRAALKAAGCTPEERRVLRFLQDAAVEEAGASTLYISGVRFGEFVVNDKCASGLVEGCDNVAAPVEIYYESEDNREATEEEAQIMMEKVIKAIQAEEYEGAQIDNFVGEVHTSGGKNVKGIIAGTAVAGAALVAGAVVYKRFGKNLSTAKVS